MYENYRAKSSFKGEKENYSAMVKKHTKTL